MHAQLFLFKQAYDYYMKVEVVDLVVIFIFFTSRMDFKYDEIPVQGWSVTKFLKA